MASMMPVRGDPVGPSKRANSDEYLAQYMEHNANVPEISLECVMAASGLIERMGVQRLKPRKDGSVEKSAKS